MISNKYEEMTNEEYNKYGMAEIFSMECSIKAEKLREPVIMCGEGEILEISEDEKRVLALGPKFCVRKNLKKISR